MASDESTQIAHLVTTRSDAEIAADLKKRVEEAMGPVLLLFEEAASHGLAIQWDAIGPAAPYFRHKLHNLRILKTY